MINKKGKIKLHIEFKTKPPKQMFDKIDEVIEKGLKKLGFKWISSGYDFSNKVRDIQFEK